MKMKIGATFFVAVLVISVLSTAQAQSLGQMDEAALQKYNNAKAEYLGLRDAYRTARQDWLDAKNAYLQNKSQGNLQRGLEMWKNHLMRADQTLVAYLNVIKAYVEGQPSLDETERQKILGELDSYITWLEGKQPEIQAATTRQQLTDITKTVKAKWEEIRPATKRIVGQIMNAKILWVIGQGEAAADKVEAAIVKLQSQGKDTSELEAMLEDYNSKLELAKEKHEAAKEKYAEAMNAGDVDALVREGNAFVREARQYLQAAYVDLKEIVKEIREYGKGSATLRGTGTLSAEGDGKAAIAGNGTIDISGTDGVLVVEDRYGDASVEVTGFGNKTQDGNRTRYVGSGSAKVRGSRIIVALKGDDIDLNAQGRGRARLVGTGTYKACGTGNCTIGQWTEGGVTVAVAGAVE